MQCGVAGNMTASIVMISFTYSMCYGTLPARIQRRFPILGKVTGGGQPDSGMRDVRDDSAHNRI